MKPLTPRASSLVRSLRTGGIATLVAPRNPVGRTGSALALTAVLAGVQIGLVAGHAGSELCRFSALGCGPPEPIAGGRVLEAPSSVAPTAPSAAGRQSSTRHAASQIQAVATFRPVAFRTQVPAKHGQASAVAKAEPGKSGMPELRRTARRSATPATLAVHGHKHAPKAGQRVTRITRHGSRRS